MKNTENTLDSNRLKCVRPTCGHEWVKKDPNKTPKACPRCKRYDWDIKGELFK